jgi:hypothetical protein
MWLRRAIIESKKKIHDLALDDAIRTAQLQKLYILLLMLFERESETERKKKRQTDRTHICRQTINDCSIEPIAISLKKQE